MDRVAIYNNTKMLQICGIIIFALLLGNVGNTLAGETMKLSENDSGKTVEMLVGDELEVMLPGKPSTGYIWEVSSLNSNDLRLGKTDFFAHNKAIGAGGSEVIRFHAIAEGESEVKLKFHRSFEPNIPPLKTFEVTVIIKK
jgi:inhibitor of cysteine peptidase